MRTPHRTPGGQGNEAGGGTRQRVQFGPTEANRETELRREEREQRREVGYYTADDDEEEGQQRTDQGPLDDEASQEGDQSSQGSIPVDEAPPTRTLVWLSNDRCRVTMTCKLPGQERGRVMAYCGHWATQCNLRGHRQKQANVQARGTSAYYVGVPTRGGIVHGRKDLRSYSQDEYGELRLAEQMDLEAAGEGFAAERRLDHDGLDQEVEARDPTYLGAGNEPHARPTATTQGQGQEPTQNAQGMRTTTTDGRNEYTRRNESHNPVRNTEDTGRNSRRGPTGNPPPRNPPLGRPELQDAATSIVGLTNQDNFPRLEDNQEDLQRLLAEEGGWTIQEYFGEDWDAAMAWYRIQMRIHQEGVTVRVEEATTAGEEDPRLAQRGQNLVLGLVNQEDYPRLETQADNVLRLLDEGGWSIRRHFLGYNPSALQWFQTQMQLYQDRRRARTARSTTPTNLTPTAGTNYTTSVDGVIGGIQQTNAGPPAAPPVPVPNWYIGLQRNQPWHRVCVPEAQGFAAVERYIGQGYEWKQRLPTRDRAIQWATQSAPSSPTMPSPIVGGSSQYTQTITGPPAGNLGGPPVGTGIGSPSLGGGTMPVHRSQPPPMFMIGTDPYAGDDTRIFGLSVIDQGAIDGALVPDGLAQGKDTLSLYERCMDVAALPGSSTDQGWDGNRRDDLQETMEITAIALSQVSTGGARTGRALLYKAARNTPLLSVKSIEDLENLTERVSKAAEDDWKTQTKQLKSFMMIRGYGPETIGQNVDSGGAPRLILRSISHYKSLLEEIIRASRLHADGKWEGSFAQTMVKYWGTKLADTRKRSENYRDLVIEVYIVLRDGYKKKWHDNSFYRVMWKHVETHNTLLGDGLGVGRASASGGTNSSPSSNTRCGHCKHRLGHATTECPLHTYKSIHAVALLKDVTGRAKAKSLSDALKARAPSSSTDEDILSAIAAVRAEAGL